MWWYRIYSKVYIYIYIGIPDVRMNKVFFFFYYKEEYGSSKIMYEGNNVSMLKLVDKLFLGNSSVKLCGFKSHCLQ